MLVIVGAFWFLLIGPRHKKYSAAATAASTAQSRKATAQETVAKALVAKKNYPADYSQLAQLGKAVPVEDEVPSLVYQLSNTSDANNIDFRSIKLTAAAGSAAPAAPAAAAAPAPTSTTDTTSTSTTPTSGTAAAPPATSIAASTLPPGAAIGSAGFPTMPFQFTFDGSFFDMSSFLRDVDRFIVSNKQELAVRGRLLSIDGFALTSSRHGFPDVSASINATAFLLPADEGLTNGATPTAPSATAAPGSSSTGAAAPTTAAIGAQR
jgi:Tfp pilus assembly protein PilO